MSSPAIAGPMIRELWMTTLLSATALTTRSGPTSSIGSACRAGLSSASTIPRNSTAPYTTAGVTTPANVVTARIAAGTIMSTWVTSSSRRLSTWSASTPPTCPRRSSGTNCSAATSPTARPSPVSSTMSHIAATFWIQLPLVETTWPAK